MTASAKPNTLRGAILEIAEGMRRAGIMTDANYRKITVCQLGPDAPVTAEPITGEESAPCASTRT